MRKWLEQLEQAAAGWVARVDEEAHPVVTQIVSGEVLRGEPIPRAPRQTPLSQAQHTATPARRQRRAETECPARRCDPTPF